jgi:hypothetical protein
VSVLVVAQSSLEIPEGLMNNPVYTGIRGVAPLNLTSVRDGGDGQLHTPTALTPTNYNVTH